MYSVFSYNQRAAMFALKTIAAAALVFGSTLHAQVIVGTNAEPEAFDQSYGIRTFDFGDVSTFIGRPVKDVDVSISFDKTPDDEFSPPFYQEITFSLLAIDPVTFDFNEVFLIDQFTLGLGPDGGSFSGTIHFSDLALISVADDPENLTAGTFRPVDSLAQLRGITFDPNLWGIFIEDIQVGSPLTYRSAEVAITFQPVPEPSTVGAAGALLLLGVALVRRVRASGVKTKAQIQA